MEPILKVSDLTKTFEDRKKEKFYAVDHVSFQMMPGQTLGIVGESGSGKSTLARLLCCLEKPDGGVLSCAAKRSEIRNEKKSRGLPENSNGFSGSGQLFRRAGRWGKGSGKVSEMPEFPGKKQRRG